MADALCGPSNPLQTLQKHTQLDRTLQQDRLVGSRQSPAQGFRTADPRAGSLDADFHAFETSSPHPFQFQQHEFAHHLPGPQPQHHASPAPGGWATDFQRLNLNEHPIPAGQFRTEAPLVRSTVGGWQNEFLRQRSSPVAQGKQAVRNPMDVGMSTFGNQGQTPMHMNYSQPMFQQPYGGFQQPQQQFAPATNVEQHAQMSDMDFEAAFADALSHAQQMDQEAQMTDTQEPVLETSQESVKIGSDAIHYRERAERTADQDTRDADDLARTAGQLLHSVQHETSDKFQNSQFLKLMQKIRDREVEVHNNDLQSTDKQPLAAASSSAVDDYRRELEVLERGVHGQKNSQTQDSHFEFPDMDAVYAPTNTSADEITAEHIQHNPSYGFDDDQYPASRHHDPQNQMQALHPGGKFYPEQSPYPGMEQPVGQIPESAGGNGIEDGATLERRISASDFEYVDESAGLARRFVRAHDEMGI